MPLLQCFQTLYPPYYLDPFYLVPLSLMRFVDTARDFSFQPGNPPYPYLSYCPPHRTTITGYTDCLLNHPFLLTKLRVGRHWVRRAWVGTFRTLPAGWMFLSPIDTNHLEFVPTRPAAHRPELSDLFLYWTGLLGWAEHWLLLSKPEGWI